MWILRLLLGHLLSLQGINPLCQEFYVSSVPTMNGRNQEYALIDKYMSHSVESCIEACYTNSSCVTFFYNSNTGQCQTHSILLKPNSADQRDADWKYYQFYTENCAPKDGLILYRKENLCYFLSNDMKSWFDAKKECNERRMRFLQIKNKEVDDHLTKTLAYYYEHSDYLGCYGDNRNRALPKRLKPSGDMYVAKCRKECHENGYTYAGLQNSNECFCGNDTNYKRYGECDRCTKDCTGKSGEKCGGYYANSVYKVGEYYYIGLRINKNVQRWSDGKLVEGYSDWAPKQDFHNEQSCTFLEPLQDYRWKRKSCTNELHFLCEKSL